MVELSRNEADLCLQGMTSSCYHATEKSLLSASATALFQILSVRVWGGCLGGLYSSLPLVLERLEREHPWGKKREITTLKHLQEYGRSCVSSSVVCVALEPH